MGMGMLIWIFDYGYWEDSLDQDILIVIDCFEIKNNKNKTNQGSHRSCRKQTKPKPKSYNYTISVVKCICDGGM